MPKSCLNLCYTSTCIKTLNTIHQIMLHTLQWTAEAERNCCSEYHRSAVIPILVQDARIAHACAIVYWKMFAKSLRYTSISGKVKIRFWISRQVRFLLMRWGWGLGQKPNYKASDTWESWGLNDEMHFSTSIIQNAKIFLLLRNITSCTTPVGVGRDAGRQPAIWMICWQSQGMGLCDF